MLMLCTSKQHGSLKAAGGFPVVTVAVCILGAAVFSAAPARALDTSAGKPAIRVVGPPEAKGVLEALAVEFAKDGTPVGMEYMRVESPAAAVGVLIGGRDMMLSIGKITEKELGRSARRWKTLAPKEYIIAARVVAIVVHQRSVVETLTLRQLETIFSGKVRYWTAFGGRRKTIRGYGLTYTCPLTPLFHETVLPAGRCRMLGRKKSSTEVLTALAGDPDGIAFVDAVAAMAAGDTVRIIAIGAGKAAVAPNAETIKDGTYPLADTLVLYVSPDAAEASRGFAAFVASGKGDRVIRAHGFVPTLRAAIADPLMAFEMLYGADIKRVKATSATADDLVQAAQMIQSSRTDKLDPRLLAAMCEAAHELAASVSGGETLAFEALGVLSSKVPDKRFDCAVKRAELWERVYKTGRSRGDGEHLVSALMAAGDLGTPPRRYIGAGEAWKRALAVAEEINSPKLTVIKKRMPAFAARVKSEQEAKTLSAKLRAAPRDARARNRMLMVQLVELDNSLEAAKYLDAAKDEATKTNTLLAIEPLERLSEDATLKLAEWYASLSGKAGAGGKELMDNRARACYRRFFKLHKDHSDALAMRASLGMQKVGGKALPKPRGKPPVSAGLKRGEEITDLKLAEFVAAHPDLRRLGRREIGTARQITDLRPLARLKKLTSLELHQSGKIKDLAPLGGLSNLTHLTLTGLETGNISALSGLSKLTSLDLNGAEKVADISTIGRLGRLRRLNLSGCVKVSDLTPIAQLTELTDLNLSGCQGVDDVAPLSKVSGTIVTLNLSGTKSDYVYYHLGRMKKLRTLDLRRCNDVSPGDVGKLAKRLSKCKVLSDAPAGDPKQVSPRRL